jgi:putative ABC transport system permease protein
MCPPAPRERRKGRTLLAALSIAVGIAAVVWVVAIGKAGARRAEAQLAALGEGLVYVSAGSRNVGGVRTGSHGAATLTAEDAEAILAELPRIASVAVMTETSVSVVSANANWTTLARGISVSFLDTWWWTLAEGAVFTERDVEQGDAVVLLGRTAREQLFGEREAVGQDVRIGSFVYRVVGVLGTKGMSPWGRNQDDVVLLPYTTAQRRIRGKGFAVLSEITCRTVSPAGVKVATEQVTELLRQRHHIAPGSDDDFEIRHFEESANAELEVSQTFANLLLGVACIALVVGGIGIMNMMLASVAERTREIGLRLSVGASERAVQAQFLLESVMLSICGGVAGVVASAAGPYVAERVLGWEVTIPLEAVLLALGFSVAVGIVFGFYPAWRASRLDPITALREE